ncbi:hypothetical protein ACVTWW_004787, partial [Escherichia coli]
MSPHKQHEAHRSCRVTLSTVLRRFVPVHSPHLLYPYQVPHPVTLNHSAQAICFTLTPYSPFFAIPVYRKVF